MIRYAWYVCIALIVMGSAANALAEPTHVFMSMRSGKVNMRVGPGNIYPIIWVYVLKGMPVKVVGKNNEWLQIQDKDGETGWIYHRMVTKTRTAMTTSNDVLLHSHPDNNAGISARLMKHVVVVPLACRPSWCHILIPSSVGGKVSGWVRRQYLWGIDPTELFEE